MDRTLRGGVHPIDEMNSTFSAVSNHFVLFHGGCNTKFPGHIFRARFDAQYLPSEMDKYIGSTRYFTRHCNG